MKDHTQIKDEIQDVLDHWMDQLERAKPEEVHRLTCMAHIQANAQLCLSYAEMTNMLGRILQALEKNSD